MKILLVSPLGFAVTPDTKYAGIEKLVYQYTCELIKEHDVTVMGHADSIFPQDIKILPYKPSQDPIFSELPHYQSYQYLLRTFDIIHDFSHSHLAARFNVNLPTLNIFWHAPAIAKYPKAPYNIIGLSQWACREFKRVYHQEARYQETIIIDPEVYHPLEKERGNRFLTIGRMAPEKGNLRALQLCLQANVPLDVAGGRGMAVSAKEPLTDYEKAIQTLAKTNQNQFLGEISEDVKVSLMQSCRALLYYLPQGYAEVTSHKILEALFCGAPIITSSAGAMPELITHGINGFLCRTDEDYLEAIKNIDTLDPMKSHNEIINKYCIENVVKAHEQLYKQVKDGSRW